MFDNNFSKCGPIFQILSPVDSRENYQCYLEKFENLKMLPNFYVERDN